jgi:hypothetical protein
MFFVKLIDHGIRQPLTVMAADAKTCYSATPIDIDNVSMDIEGTTWGSGHHTTIMSPSSFVFQIEGPAVSTVTLGLHLANQFYNSGQRSGRFCLNMFNEIKTEEFYDKLKLYYKVDDNFARTTVDFIESGINLFASNIDRATKLVAKTMETERPRASQRYIDQNSQKIAQEQLRVFISSVVPTGLVFNIDLVTLSAYNRTAHTPEMWLIVKMMIAEVLKEFPELDFLFKTKDQPRENWSPKLTETDSDILRFTPKAVLKSIDSWPDGVKMPEPSEISPFDSQYSDRRYMSLSTRYVNSNATLSLMTMGQDQRHRTIGRSEPVFTGEFFLPPIVSELNLEKEARQFMLQWLAIYKKNPDVASFVAPYGIVVCYDKAASFTALIHEQNKRLCLCAESEIYELSRQLRQQIQQKAPNHKILQLMVPPCYKTGACREGKRYCGRDLSKIFDFPERRI